MATTTTTTTKAAADKPSPDTVQDRDQELAELREKYSRLLDQAKAAATAAAAPDEPKPAKLTHLLLLANGETVRTASPCATEHYGADGDGPYAVLSAHEIREEV